jgi:hypothetical protein
MRSLTYYLQEVVLRPLKYALVILTGAPRWHIATTYNKDYSNSVIQYLNDLSNRHDSIAEIGCGTCDILRSVKYEKKDGYDVDARVLIVAKILNILFFSKINLKKYDFVHTSSKIWKYDVVVLINWTHEVEFYILKDRLNDILNGMNDGGRIVIDMVTSKDYKYNHDIQNIFPSSDMRIEIIFYNNIREVYSVGRVTTNV